MMKQFTFTIIFLFLFNVISFSEQRENALFSVVSGALKNHEKSYNVNELIYNGKWNSDKTALVIFVPDGLSSLLYVFVKQDGGAFIAVDISYRVNREMDYKLGRNRNYYEKYVQTPVIVNMRNEYVVGIGIKTQAWKDGQRYTVETKPTLIKKNGEKSDP